MVNRADELQAILDNMKGKKRIDIGRLSDEDSICVVSGFISTGCLALDRILGGGLPLGRMTEFYGEPSSGKSLVAAQLAAVAQQDENMVVAYIDTEGAVSIGQMRRIGVDVDNLLYSSPETIEEVFDTLDVLIEQTAKADKQLLFIWDSIAATSSLAELDKVDEKGFGQTGYLDHARIMSQALRVIMKKVGKNQVALLVLNQTREKMGVLFGDKEATFGGKAVSFYSSVRVRLALSSKIKKAGSAKKNIIGVNTIATAVKNKIAIPYLTVTLPIYFRHGIRDSEASYLWLRDEGYITGTSSMTLSMPEYDEIKFQKAGWAGLYDDEGVYSAIEALMVGEDLDNVEEGEVEEDTED